MINSFSKKIWTVALALLMVSLFIGATTTSVSADVLSDRIADVTASDNETSFVQSIVELSIPFAVIALIGLSAYAGFLMVTSQGNPEKLAEAKEVFTNAVLGFGLIALSVAVLVIIQNVLKLPGVTP